jgi:uncharacterized Zn-finger protein
MNKLLNNAPQKCVSYFVVYEKDLPFHCPPKGVENWNMHPKVFIQFDKNGKGICPYCSADYELSS